jgi:hypothetical protein
VRRSAALGASAQQAAARPQGERQARDAAAEPLLAAPDAAEPGQAAAEEASGAEAGPQPEARAGAQAGVARRPEARDAAAALLPAAAVPDVALGERAALVRREAPPWVLLSALASASPSLREWVHRRLAPRPAAQSARVMAPRSIARP